MRRNRNLIILLSLSTSIILFAVQVFANTDGFSSSVRLNGMGEAGVAVTDGNSACYNPAQISFPLNDYDLYVTGSPGRYSIYKTDDGSTDASRINVAVIGTVSEIHRNNGTRLRFNMGFEYVEDNTELRTIDDWDPGQSDIREINDYLYRASFGFGIDNSVPFSCGISVNWFKGEGINDYRRSVDLGVLFGLPSSQMYNTDIPAGTTEFNIYPSMGFAIQQMGKKRDNPAFWEDYYFIEETAIKRYGGAVKFSWDANSRYGRFSKFYVMPSFESLSQYETNIKFGVELGFYDAIQLRYGHNGIHRYHIKNTYGLGISGRGIAKVLSRGDSQSMFTRKLDIRFDYAYQKYANAPDGFNFIGISVAY